MVDHCTGWFEGWWGELCCKPHDDGYRDQIGQALADTRLFDCVAHALPAFAAGHPVLAAVLGAVSFVVAALMTAAVRLFGAPFYRRAGRKP